MRINEAIFSILNSIDQNTFMLPEMPKMNLDLNNLWICYTLINRISLFALLLLSDEQRPQHDYGDTFYRMIYYTENGLFYLCFYNMFGIKTLFK